MTTLTEHIAEIEFLDNAKKVDEHLVKMLERKQRIEDHSGMIYNHLLNPGPSGSLPNPLTNFPQDLLSYCGGNKESLKCLEQKNKKILKQL